MATHEALQKAQLFRGLSEAEARGLVSIARELHLGPGEYVFSEGDKGDGLYLLLEGAVEVRKAKREGGAHALANVGVGGVLWWQFRKRDWL